MNNTTTQLEQALKDFLKAQVALNSAWMDHDNTGDLLCEEYPYPLCFDDLTSKVKRWVNTSLKSLQSNEVQNPGLSKPFNGVVIASTWQRISYFVIQYNSDAKEFRPWANEVFKTLEQAERFCKDNQLEVKASEVLYWLQDDNGDMNLQIKGWQVYNIDHTEVKEQDIDTNDYYGGDAIVKVLFSSKKFHILMHSSGTFSCTAGRNELNKVTFDECVKLIEEEMGEKVN